jgi:hypothetical protein
VKSTQTGGGYRQLPENAGGRKERDKPWNMLRSARLSPCPCSRTSRTRTRDGSQLQHARASAALARLRIEGKGRSQQSKESQKYAIHKSQEMWTDKLAAYAVRQHLSYCVQVETEEKRGRENYTGSKQ